MGRGRAPCCDKGHVNRGPWSPEEDLRLISFIRMYGHDNWMALPKKAGLLRCGKSCRLRWINYLRPGLKRGNFTKEEEETIIRLHQSFGNKWARIAADLPGRTDNEIKNIWNTRLKKRLAQKPVGCWENVTKGSPVITSSSLSTVESSQNYQIIELDCQINNMLPHDVSSMKTAEMESSRTTFALNQSSVTNQVARLQVTELSNKFGSTFQPSGQPLNSKSINQLEDSAIWEDPIFLEPLLDIDEDPNRVLPPLSTQIDSTENTSSHELLLEPDFDSWSMLNYDVMPAPPKPDDKDTDKEAPMSEMSINAGNTRGVTKGSSVITSSSSSSTVVASNQQCQKTEKNSQTIPRDVSTLMTGEMESSKTTFGINQSSVANQVAGLQDSEPLYNFGPISQHSEKFIDSSGNNQLEDFFPNSLDPLLNLEEYPNWELLYLNSQTDPIEHTSSYELLWSDMNNNVIPAPARPVDKEAYKAYPVETPMGEESVYAAQVPELSQCQTNDLIHISPSAPTGNDVRVLQS